MMAIQFDNWHHGYSYQFYGKIQNAKSLYVACFIMI